MKYDPRMHQRRLFRLKGYDYSLPGAYFVTVCTYQRECLLGEIHQGEMLINELGQFVIQVWKDLPDHYPHVILDAFCVMPNHFHGIIILSDIYGGGEIDLGDEGDKGDEGESETRPYKTQPYEARPYEPTASDSSPPPQKRHGLPEIVRALKSFSARLINQRRDTQGVPVWQRNYYERIVRNEHELNAIRQYVYENPMKWEMDMDNPSNIEMTML
jgi:REP element-mobilizing transposase RayT